MPISNNSFHHLPDPTVEMLRRDQDGLEAQRTLAEECPVAFVYTAAVVMATPADLKDLALGFSLTEGIIDNVAGLKSLDIIPEPSGVELRMWLADTSEQRFRRRQRRLVGPTGCGLCGIESLADATRPAPHLTRSITIRTRQVESALVALSDAQMLNRATRATHAAGFFHPDQELVAVREDVGRHNALDKLAGTLASTNISAGEGAIVLTSRVSIELVQKAAAIGCPMLVAVSAPTALAVRAAEACGITLIAVARGSAFEIFSHPDVIRG
ncbi:formate dehydrogenase accessory sulfurtransferase FdhD [Bradyrhizobium sp. BEA-2-5]|uniref:formate dehydrogenase accessory sulfurtransferase FdhD n=1 Tax=Bradyrhizobium sp. BEA-2-5 TaxID=3080015 RepID=UPI00397D27F8